MGKNVFILVWRVLIQIFSRCIVMILIQFCANTFMREPLNDKLGVNRTQIICLAIMNL